MGSIQQALIGTSDGRRASLRAAGLFLGAALLLALIPFAENAGLWAIVCGLFACFAVPAYIQWQRGTLDFFEPVHVIGGLYFVTFGLGSLWTLGDPSRVAYDRYIVAYIPTAAALCLLGYAFMLVGYYGPWSGRRTREEEEFPRGMLFIVVPATLGFLGFIAQALQYRAYKLGLSIAAVISSLGQLAPLFLFAWALAWLLLFSRSARRFQRWLLLGGLIPAAVVVALYSLNRKATTVALLLIPLTALWYARRKIPWLTLVALGLLVVFVVFPFNNTFRALDPRISATERLRMTSTIIGQWDARHYLDRSVGTFKARMSHVNSVAVVVRDVPRWVPFARGRTIFLPTLQFFIPRVLWADKPVMTFGREFGETFRVVHILDHETNIAATIPGELYWNYSVPGIVIGMALWGMVLRLYYRRYGETPQLDPVRRAIYLVLLLQFVSFEAGISAPAVMAIRTLLVLEGYRLLGRHFSLVVVRSPRARAAPTAG